MNHTNIVAHLVDEIFGLQMLGPLELTWKMENEFAKGAVIPFIICLHLVLLTGLTYMSYLCNNQLL